MIFKAILFIYFNIMSGIQIASIERNLSEIRKQQRELIEIKETLAAMRILMMTHKEFLQVICMRLTEDAEERQSDYRLE